jgi:hypothetical protein
MKSFTQDVGTLRVRAAEEVLHMLRRKVDCFFNFFYASQ